MLVKHWTILQTRLRQTGVVQTLRFTLLKLMRKLLVPGVEFHFGMTAEDIVLTFLAEKYLGRTKVVYVDIGCHEPRRISNSYLFYLNGSSGLAIDLDPRHASAFRRHRPNDMFVCAAVSDTARSTLVHEYGTSEVNTIDSDQARVWQSRFQFKGQRAVETTTLSELLQRYMPSAKIDLLLLDVEGHELAVLHGADLASLQPAIIACELHDLDLRDAMANPVVELLAGSGYGLAGYATVNGYFVRNDLLPGSR